MTLAARLGVTEKQAESIARSDARVNLWEGAVSSGKTIGSLFRWLQYVADAPRGGELLVVGRTRQSIARNVFGPLADPSMPWRDAATEVRYTSGADTARILGRTVHVLGASDVRSEAVLRGLSAAGAYVDEATLVAEPFWQQLRARLRVPGAQLFATTNPDAPAHWLKREVIDRAGELGYRTFRFGIDDNPYNDPAFVTQVKREYTGLWYRRFVLGEWTVAEGAVFDMWDPDRHVLPAATVAALPLRVVVALGIDYGTTNPTRGYLLAVTAEPRPRLVVLDEWAPPTGLADVQQSVHLRAWLAAQPAGWGRPEWVTVDPSAASFRRQLANDDVPGVAAATNDVLAGIRTLASLLATDSLVVSDACTQLVRYLPGYAWDPKATALGEDAPVKADDHEVDALRYAVHTTRQLWRDVVPVVAAVDTAPAADRPLAA